MSLTRSNIPMRRGSQPLLPASTPEDHERSPSIPQSNQLGSSERWLGSPAQRRDYEQDTPLKRRRSGRTSGKSPGTETAATRRKERPTETASRVRRSNGADKPEGQKDWIAALAEAAGAAIASGIEKAIAVGIEAAVARGIEKVAPSNSTNAAVAAHQANPLQAADRASPSEDESSLSTRLEDAPQRGGEAMERSANTQESGPSNEVAVVRTPDGRFAKKQRVSSQGDARGMPRSPRVRDSATRSNRVGHAVSAPLSKDSNGRNGSAGVGEQTNSPPSMIDGSAEHLERVDTSKNRRPKRAVNTANKAVLDNEGIRNKSGKGKQAGQQVASPSVIDLKGTSQGTQRKRETRSSLKSSLDHNTPNNGAPAESNASPSATVFPFIAGDDSQLHRPATENRREKPNSKGKADSAVAAKKDKLTRDVTDDQIAPDGATGSHVVQVVDRVEIPVETEDAVEVMNHRKPKETTRQRRRRTKTALNVGQGESAMPADGEPSASGDHARSREGLDVAGTAPTQKAVSKKGAAEGGDDTVTEDTGIDIERKKRKAAERREQRKRRKTTTEDSVNGGKEPRNEGMGNENRVEREETQSSKKTKKLVRNTEQSTGNRVDTDSQLNPEIQENPIQAHTGDDQGTAISHRPRDDGKVTGTNVSVAETEMVVPDNSTTDDSDAECHRDLELPCGHKRRKNWNASLYHVDREGHRNRIGTWEELWRWTTRSKFSAQHPTVYKTTPKSICPRCPGTSDRGRISGRHYFGDGYYWVVTYFQPPSGSRVANIINAQNVNT